MPTILTLLRFTVRVLIGRLVGWEPQPLRVRLGGVRSRSHAYLLPDGRLLPGVAGGDGSDDPDPDPEPDPDPDPDPAPDPDPDDDDDDDDPDDDEDPANWDRERAANTIRNQREERKQLKREAKEAKRRADAAEAERNQLRQAQESEQEKIQRERDEYREQAETASQRADRLLVDSEIRDLAIDKGVDPKRVKRVLRLIDRDDITVEDGEVDGVDEALDEVLGDFPEFLTAAPPPADPPEDDEEDDDVPERKGGNPDRKRKVKPMTAEQAAKLAKDDPQKFNQLFEEGRIPASALR